MAKFNKKVLGTVAGALGDVVFKTRVNKTYVASRPANPKVAMDEVSVFNRNKFRFISKLSGAINQVFWYRYIWKNSNAPGQIVNNKVYSANYPRLKSFDLNNVLLLPIEEGFSVELISFSLINQVLSVTTSPLGDDSGVKTNNRVSLQGILLMTETNDTTVKPYSFISFSCEDVINVPGEQLTFSTTLEGVEDFNKLRNYNKLSMAANLLTKNKEGLPKNASVNICYQQNL